MGEHIVESLIGGRHMSQARVCQHLRSVGLDGGEAARWAGLVYRQLRASGPEWIVERLKSLKPLLQEVANTGSYTVPLGFATRKNRRGETIFKDGLLHRLFSRPLSPEHLRLVEGFLRVYQVIHLDKISKKQKEKILNNIEGPSTARSSEFVNKYSKLIGTSVRGVSAQSLSDLLSRADSAKSLPMLLNISTTKRSPYLNENGVWKTAPRSKVESALWWDYAQSDNLTREFWAKHPNFFEERVTGNRMFVNGRPSPGDGLSSGDFSAGKIAVIQEGGCKARTIANPMLLFQALGEPMKVKLQEYTRLCYPEVCTFDHERGYSSVVQWLEQGRKVWCFDASAFTDRFPLQLQEAVIDSLVDQHVLSNEDRDAFMLVINKGWHWDEVGREVKWSVGQPLGYGPSFHLATLTHAVVCDFICRSFKLGNRDFRIVGDDVVIANEQLAEVYQRTMCELGVEINLSKSAISDKLGEFLGKQITKWGVSPSIKVKLLREPAQLLSALGYYGQRALDHLLPLERKWARSAYLPEDLGGLGWRPVRSGLRNWLDITNQDSFARQRVLKDIYTFYGKTPERGSDVDRKDIDLTFEYYSRNQIDTDGPTRYEGVKYTFEDALRLPSHGSARKGAVNLEANSFADRFDSMMSQLITPPGQTSPSSDAVHRHAMNLLTKHGYINPMEKPPKYKFRGQSDQENPHDNRAERAGVSPDSTGEQQTPPRDGPRFVRIRDLARDSETAEQVKNQIETDGYKPSRPKGWLYAQIYFFWAYPWTQQTVYTGWWGGCRY
nr:MAG: putative RNA-dependent RNA polymerase [Mitoviridae sp.]UOL49049.1 MAG: putative RNA-dependent RNA polymerase [Mitoviridae sp.]